MLEYSPIWSPWEVHEPNFNLQLCESWGHCLRSTWDHNIDNNIDDSDDDDDDDDDASNDDDDNYDLFPTLQKALNLAGGTQRTTPVLKTRKCVSPKCWNYHQINHVNYDDGDDDVDKDDKIWN